MGKATKKELDRLQRALLSEEELPTQQQDLTGRLYNTDKTDTDLDSFSEAVLAGKKPSRAGLVILLLLIAALILWWIFHNGGILT